ncbi:MAG: energy transducer TonB family protein [Thermotogota bacterium]
MYCKHCGKLLANSSNYCKFCGKKQKKPIIIERDEKKMPVTNVVIGAFVIIGVLISVHILDRRYIEQQKEKIYYNNESVGNRHQNKNITASGESQRDVYVNEKVNENRRTRKKVNSKALLDVRNVKGNSRNEKNLDSKESISSYDSLKSKRINYTLAGRKAISLPKPVYNYQEEGKVVVGITVDRFGRITKAIPSVKKSTTRNKNLLQAAKMAALRAKFDKNSDAPAYQSGAITYHFLTNQ